MCGSDREFGQTNTHSCAVESEYRIGTYGVLPVLLQRAPYSVQVALVYKVIPSLPRYGATPPQKYPRS